MRSVVTAKEDLTCAFPCSSVSLFLRNPPFRYGLKHSCLPMDPEKTTKLISAHAHRSHGHVPEPQVERPGPSSGHCVIGRCPLGLLSSGLLLATYRCRFGSG